MNTVADAPLVRGVGRWALVALIFNTVLGAGILGLPSRAYAAAGIYSLLGLGLALILMLGVALCLAELSSRYDSTGGPYVYVEQAYGERPAARCFRRDMASHEAVGCAREPRPLTRHGRRQRSAQERLTALGGLDRLRRWRRA